MADLGKTAAVFPGGGFACVGEGGFWKAIEEHKIPIQRIQCISASTFLSAKYLEGGFAALKAELEELERRGPHHIFRRRDAAIGFILGRETLYRNDGLHELAKRINIDKVVNSPTEMEVAVWNGVTDELEIFVNHQFRNGAHEIFRQLIVASSCFPGLFNPISINDVFYSDPGEYVLDRSDSHSFRDFDTIFIVEPNQPQFVRWYSTLMERYHITLARSMVKEIANFILKYGFQIFPPEEISETAKPKKSFWVKVWSGVTAALKEPLVSKKRLVIVNIPNPIQTLTLQSFRSGDIKQAVQMYYDRTNEILKTVFGI
jgi:hypothetical protein